jgi:hypothetical protein
MNELLNNIIGDELQNRLSLLGSNWLHSEPKWEPKWSQLEPLAPNGAKWSQKGAKWSQMEPNQFPVKDLTIFLV